MYSPKSDEETMKAINRCAQDPYMKFNVQEIGIYEKMVDYLRPASHSQELRMQEALDFIIKNSQPITGGIGLQQFVDLKPR